MRILGVDFGDKRTGIAVSDELGMLAQPIGTISEDSPDKLVDRIIEIAKSNNVAKIILGLPKNMNGTLGQRAEKTSEFGKLLHEKSGINVEFLDERMTTMGATGILNDCNVRGAKRKQVVDTVSAVLILQNYLDKGGNTNGR